jgi:hypothetical protein
MGLPTKLLADGETPLVVLRPHVRRLVRPALLLLLLSPAAAFAAGAVPPGSRQPTIRAVIAAVAAVVLLRWVVWPFVLWWNTLYVLTDERIFERAGVVRRTGHDLPLRGVTDVVVAQRLAERMLRSGTLAVTTESGAQFTLTDVPAVTRLQRTLLAVADDVAERFAARPPRRQSRADGEEPGGRYLQVHAPPLPAAAPDGDSRDDGDDQDYPDGRSRRRELRQRERESTRRLRALQDEVRRTPARAHPDSPLEDDGAADGPAAANPPHLVDDVPAEPADEGPAPGARILRFPRRP